MLVSHTEKHLVRNVPKPTTALCSVMVLFVLLAAPCNGRQIQSDQFAPMDSLNVSGGLLDTSAVANFDHRPLRWYSMITNIPQDYAGFYHRSFRTEYIPLYGLIVGSTALLIATDENTWQSSNRWYHQNQTVSSLSNFFTSLGDGKTQFGLGALFALKGWISDDPHALRTGSQIVEAVLASGSLVQILKHMTGRESPFTESKPGGAWRFFPNQIQYHKHIPAYDAYPSGHLTTAIATVVVIAENYPDEKWIGPVGYGLSGLLAVSMVNRGIHWYSDYPLAIALGYSFGMAVVHPEGTEQAEPVVGLSQRTAGLSGARLLQVTFSWHLRQ